MGAREHLLARAHATVPEHGRLTQRLAELDERIAAARVGIPSEDQVRDAIVEEIAAGGRIPDDPEREVLATRTGQMAAEARLAVLLAARVRVVQEREGALAAGLPRMFAVLADEAEDITEEVVALGSVPHSADEAIRLGREHEYRQVADLVDRYGALRAVWRELWRLGGHTGPITGAAQWMPAAVLVEHDPEIVARLAVDGPRDIDGGVPVLVDPWPGFVLGRNAGDWPVDDRDRPGWLCWAATRRAIWAPSPKQFRSAIDEIEVAVSDAVLRANRGLPPQDGHGGEPRRGSGAPDERKLAAIAANSAAAVADRARRGVAEGARR